MTWLRLPLIFFVEFMILVLLLAAALDPRWPSRTAANDLVVVLDDSASMQAELPSGQPRERALQAIDDAIRRYGFRSLRIILAGTEPIPLPGRCRTMTDVRAVLKAWHCSAPAADLDGAIARALGFSVNDRILVLTDHAPDSPPTGDRVRWLAFGTRADNVGIIHAGRAPAAAGDRGFIVVGNYSPRQSTITLSMDGTAVQRLTLASNETRRVDFRIPGEQELARLSLDSDILGIDNTALLVRSVPRKASLHMDIASPSLRTVLGRAVAASGLAELTAERDKADTIFSDKTLPVLPADTWAVRFMVGKGGKAYTGPFIVDHAHPLTDGLDLDGVVWGATGGEDLPGIPVIAAGNVSLLSVKDRGIASPIITVKYCPEMSTLQTHPSWPALVWNLLAWRNQSLPGIRNANLRVGIPATIGDRLEVHSLQTVLPDGHEETIQRTLSGFSLPTPLPGLYRLRSGKTDWILAANLLAPGESDLSGGSSGDWGRWTSSDVLVRHYTGFRWGFLLSACFLLGVHWIMMVRATP